MDGESISSMQFERMPWGLTFIIGLGFFTTGITWSLYNSYVPIFLRNIIESDPYWYALLALWINTFIGIVMILDNIAAITLQPWIGAKSDNTWTRFGRRMPYLMVGIPIAALFFAFIPVVKDLILLLLIIMVFNITMALYRAPVVALMPDIIPSKFRSKANGVINFMGGVGAVYAFFVGSYIYEYFGAFWTFAVTSIIMITALIILMLYIKEPEKPLDVEERISIIKAFNEVLSDEDKSALFMLLAIMFWFFAYNIIETWFTTYGVLILNVTEYEASRALTGFALVFILFAIPAGFIATKIGRRKTIIYGLIGLTALLFIIGFLRSLLLIAVLLAVAGICWAMININSIVIVWEIGGYRKLGAYTGLYYFFSSIAAIFGPLIAGTIFDLVGFEIMFFLSVGFLIVALICMLGVKKGEVHVS